MNDRRARPYGCARRFQKLLQEARAALSRDGGRLLTLYSVRSERLLYRGNLYLRCKRCSGGSPEDIFAMSNLDHEDKQFLVGD